MTDSQAKIEKAEQYYSQGESTKAQAMLEDVLKIDPGNPEALNNLGVIAFDRNNCAAAERYLGDAVIAHPDHFESQINLISVFLSQKKFVKALLAALNLRFNEPQRDELRHLLDQVVETIIHELLDSADGPGVSTFAEHDKLRQQVPAVLRTLNSLLKQQSEADARLRLVAGSLLFLSLDKWEDARNIAIDVNRLSPHKLSYLLYGAWLHLNLNESYEARYYLHFAASLPEKSEMTEKLLNRAASKCSLPACWEKYREILVVAPAIAGRAGRFVNLISALKRKLPESRFTLLSTETAAAPFRRWVLLDRVIAKPDGRKYDLGLCYNPNDDLVQRLAGQIETACRSVFVFTEVSSDPPVSDFSRTLHLFEVEPVDAQTPGRVRDSGRLYRPVHFLIDEADMPDSGGGEK